MNTKRRHTTENGVRYMKESITTLQGIKLMKRCVKLPVFGVTGPWEFFVNGKEVVYWEYEKTNDEFYEEKITIKAFAKQINTLTGKVS